MFPGLEYLLDDEVSSDTAFAAERYANRTVPHPYKIAVPLMAVSHAGAAVGLLWDANQEWHNAWRHPAAQFSSPNRIHPEAANHWMALCAPAVEPRWRNEAELEAHAPCDGRVWTLSARYAAVPRGGVMGMVRAWVKAYGLPPMPASETKSDFAANVELCVRSYLDVAWDDAAEGWHHTLSDPWGPRFEANVANQLWRYGRWPGGDPLLRARARDQVRRAVSHAQSKDTASAPHLDLALVYGQVADALAGLAAGAGKAMDEQRPDGAWPWKPDVVAQAGDLKTEDRLRVMGKVEDSSSGFTAGKAQPVAAYALATGDPQAVASVLRAADWCNAQRRPEGAQTWELHLHVPDVLAAPHLINLSLAAHELTGEARYLDAAQTWAWTGLPFTYLWNGFYRPVMRYGTVPVFGVTFHDVQSWFGVIVQWNGLVYAGALYRLARHRPADGPMDRRVLAEGIVRHGMQEQLPAGHYFGMYPDAYSPVKGDEEYTWWLNPNLIGANTFPLAGIPAAPAPCVLRHGEREVAHLTCGARVEQAQFDGRQLKALLSDWPGEASYAVVSRREGSEGAPPSEVACEGRLLPRVDDMDEAVTGWQWLADPGVAVVKISISQPVAALTVVW